MNDSISVHNLLDAFSKVLIRSFIIATVFLLLWFCFFLFCADMAYPIHSRWFHLSRESFNMVNYCGMALIKAVVFLFFLVPYLAIRLVLRNEEPSV